MRIVVIADSLGLPRSENGIKVRYESTYPFLLGRENKNHEIVNFSERSKTIIDARNEINEVLLYEPECIIVQIGIVDCAPRIFSIKEKFILSKLPASIRTRVIEYRKKKRVSTKRNPLSKAYVKPDDFKKTYLDLIINLKRSNKELKIIIVPIIGFLKSLEMKSIGFSNNIRMYNDLLAEIANESKSSLIAIDLFFDREDCFVDDFYHLSEYGHVL